MSQNPYFEQYSNNIVLVPAGSAVKTKSDVSEEPPVKKIRVENIPLPMQPPMQNAGPFQFHYMPVTQAQYAPVQTPGCPWTHTYHQEFNTSVQAVIPYQPDFNTLVPAAIPYQQNANTSMPAVPGVSPYQQDVNTSMPPVPGVSPYQQDVNTSVAATIPYQQNANTSMPAAILYQQDANTPMPAFIPPERANLKEIPNSVCQGSEQSSSTVENAASKKSWASNYLTSIGQVYKKPLKLNLLSSRNKVNTSTKTQISNESAQNIAKCTTLEKSKIIKKPQSITGERNLKQLKFTQPIILNLKKRMLETKQHIQNKDTFTTTIHSATLSQNTPIHKDEFQVKDANKASLSLKSASEQNKDKHTSTTHLATVSQNTPNNIHKDEFQVKNTNKTSISVNSESEQNKRICTTTTNLATLSQNTPNKIYKDEYRNKNANKPSLSLKRPSDENKDAFTNTTHLKTLCQDTPNIYINKIKVTNNTTSSLKRTVSDLQYRKKERETNTIRDAKQALKKVLKDRDQSQTSDTPSRTVYKNSFESEKHSKNSYSKEAGNKSQKDNDKQKPSTSSSYSNYKDTKDKYSHSTSKSGRKHDGNINATKFSDSKVLKHKNNQVNKDKSYKILKELKIIQDKIKKVKSESKALINLKHKKSDERPTDQRGSSDKQPKQKVLPHTKSEKCSQKDNHEESTSNMEKYKEYSSRKYCSNKQFEEVSKINQSPVKSVIQVKDNLQERPEVEKNFDLRSKISRRNLSQYFGSLRNTSKMISEKPITERDNLIITVPNENNDSTTPNSTEEIIKEKAQKVKTKKYKRLKLVINVICENAESSDSDDSADSEQSGTCAMASEDLSFLDDLNIDEIVDSLSHCTADIDLSKTTKDISVKRDNITIINDLITDNEKSKASTVLLEEINGIKNEEDDDERLCISPNIAKSEFKYAIQENPTLCTKLNVKTPNGDIAVLPRQETLMPVSEIKKELSVGGCNNSTLLDAGLNKQCKNVAEKLLASEQSAQIDPIDMTEIKKEAPDDGTNENPSNLIIQESDIVVDEEIKLEQEVVNTNLLDHAIDDPKDKGEDVIMIKKEYLGDESDKVQLLDFVMGEERKQDEEAVNKNLLDHTIDCSKDKEEDVIVIKNESDKLHQFGIKEIPEEVSESKICVDVAKDNNETDTYTETVSYISEPYDKVKICTELNSKNSHYSDSMKKTDCIELNEAGNLLGNNTQTEIKQNNDEQTKTVNSGSPKDNIISTECKNTTFMTHVKSDIDMESASNTAETHAAPLHITTKLNAENSSDSDVLKETIESNKAGNLSSNSTITIPSCDKGMKVIINTTIVDDKVSDESPEKEIKQKNVEEIKTDSSSSPKVEKKEPDRSIDTSAQKPTKVIINTTLADDKVPNASPEKDIKLKNVEQTKIDSSSSPKVVKKESERSVDTSVQKPNDSNPSLVKPNVFNNTKVLSTVSKIVSNKIDKVGNKVTKNVTVENVDEKKILKSHNRTRNTIPVKTLPEGSTSLDERKQEEEFIDKMQRTMSAYLREPYRVVALIHKGEFSNIFECANFYGRLSAVKVIRPRYKPNFSAHKDMLMSLQEDSRKLNFPRLFKTFDVGPWHSCFLMECYPKNLSQALEDVGSFHIDHVQNFSRQLVEALSVLRSNKVVHSDIKPSHILIKDSYNIIKLCGFDSAYYSGCGLLSTNMGTVNYRAPEVIVGYSAGHGIDVWSSALVMYEMATGKQLFPGVLDNDILFKQMCTLGYLPNDVIQQGRYSNRHFVNSSTTFKRVGKAVVYKEAHTFYINNILESELKNTYHRKWGRGLTRTMQIRDLAKLNSIYNLLKQMLAMHPILRLPIDFIRRSPFFEESF